MRWRNTRAPRDSCAERRFASTATRLEGFRASGSTIILCDPYSREGNIVKSKFVYTVLFGSMLLPNVASAQFSPGARSAGDPYLSAIGNGGYEVQHYDLT